MRKADALITAVILFSHLKCAAIYHIHISISKLVIINVGYYVPLGCHFTCSSSRPCGFSNILVSLSTVACHCTHSPCISPCPSNHRPSIGLTVRFSIFLDPALKSYKESFELVKLDRSI